MQKKCFKCGVIKKIADFYKHPQMGDGHLGKCKDCTKRDTSERTDRLSKNPDWVEIERERCRVKQRAARAAGTAVKLNSVSVKKWRKQNPSKRKAQAMADHAKRNGKIQRIETCEVCNEKPSKQMHHHDYSRPLDVVWVCHACHGILHRKNRFQPIGKRSILIETP